MKIRNANQNELPQIRQQRVDAYSEHAACVSPEHWEALKKAVSSEADSQPGAEIIVAEQNGEIQGSVVLFPAKTDAYEGYIEKLDYPEIRMLAVDPGARGRGIASALIEECIRRAQSKGYGAIGLHTGEFMTGAIQLYERYGFKRLPQHDFEPAGDGVIVKAFQLVFPPSVK